LLAAFLKGRRCKTSLYFVTYDEQLLNKSVGELREMVGCRSDAKNTMADYLLFVLYSVFTLSLSVLFFYGLYQAAKFIAGKF
jgi:hypothetical protein